MPGNAELVEVGERLDVTVTRANAPEQTNPLGALRELLNAAKAAIGRKKLEEQCNKSSTS